MDAERYCFAITINSFGEQRLSDFVVAIPERESRYRLGESVTERKRSCGTSVALWQPVTLAGLFSDNLPLINAKVNAPIGGGDWSFGFYGIKTLYVPPPFDGCGPAHCLLLFSDTTIHPSLFIPSSSFYACALDRSPFHLVILVLCVTRRFTNAIWRCISSTMWNQYQLVILLVRNNLHGDDIKN